MGPCKKCKCSSFLWNPVSAAEALADRIGRRLPTSEIQVTAVVVSAKTAVTGQSVDIHNSRDALRNCTCGHHYNYH